MGGTDLHDCAGIVPVGLRHPRPFENYIFMLRWNSNNYKKKERIATAIHGSVYIYLHTPTNKNVAIKVMNNKNVFDKTHLLENALVEIGVSSFLTFFTKSEFIVRMIEVCQDEKKTYFVTELSSGGELFKHVVNNGPLDACDCRRIIMQVIRGIASMHANGVIHRDISLENTLLHEGGSIRILDFGQAVRMERDDDLFTGRAGKSYYRAPEMYSSQPYKGPPCDVFAIGVMLFILALGTAPWMMANPSDERFNFINKHGFELLILKWKRRSWVSHDFIDLICGMMDTDPSRRLSLDAVMSHPWFIDYYCIYNY
eukprot:GHVL01033024.1.p1 GENE.GHVL01033024.1~~GHVL01033024.1.p1  ORF type:complete len:313 (+),score=50.54 GHVL01033024.1:52-990(+)